MMDPSMEPEEVPQREPRWNVRTFLDRKVRGRSQGGEVGHP
jgi:hypothetical protein